MSGIVLNEVHLTKESRDIISGISLDVSEARVGIIGRNGAGKSTLARLIAGLITPTSGRIEVFGIDPARDRKAALANIGILFQNPDHQIIFPTVEEEIVFGLTQTGSSRADARRAARDLLRQFNREDWADRAVHTLSQGQKHLVCLMSILAMKPKLIVMDEPYAGLDIPTTRRLNAYVDKYARHIIHITHDPELLRGYDRVIWIENGKVALNGLGEWVLDAFIARMNILGQQDDCIDDTL